MPFIAQNFKKSSELIKNCEDPPFSGQKNFKNELINLALSIYNQKKSKSDINPLMKYWRLQKTEISLTKAFIAITWGPDFSTTVFIKC